MEKLKKLAVSEVAIFSVPLVTSNLREFQRVPGLELENWV